MTDNLETAYQIVGIDTQTGENFIESTYGSYDEAQKVLKSEYSTQGIMTKYLVRPYSEDTPQFKAPSENPYYKPSNSNVYENPTTGKWEQTSSLKENLSKAVNERKISQQSANQIYVNLTGGRGEINYPGNWSSGLSKTPPITYDVPPPVAENILGVYNSLPPSYQSPENLRGIATESIKLVEDKKNLNSAYNLKRYSDSNANISTVGRDALLGYSNITHNVESVPQEKTRAEKFIFGDDTNGSGLLGVPKSIIQSSARIETSFIHQPALRPFLTFENKYIPNAYPLKYLNTWGTTPTKKDYLTVGMTVGTMLIPGGKVGKAVAKGLEIAFTSYATYKTVKNPTEANLGELAFFGATPLIVGGVSKTINTKSVDIPLSNKGNAEVKSYNFGNTPVLTKVTYTKPVVEVQTTNEFGEITFNRVSAAEQAELPFSRPKKATEYLFGNKQSSAPLDVGYVSKSKGLPYTENPQELKLMGKILDITPEQALLPPVQFKNVFEVTKLKGIEAVSSKENLLPEGETRTTTKVQWEVEKKNAYRKTTPIIKDVIPVKIMEENIAAAPQDMLGGKEQNIAVLANAKSIGTSKNIFKGKGDIPKNSEIFSRTKVLETEKILAVTDKDIQPFQLSKGDYIKLERTSTTNKANPEQQIGVVFTSKIRAKPISQKQFNSYFKLEEPTTNPKPSGETTLQNEVLSVESVGIQKLRASKPILQSVQVKRITTKSIGSFNYPGVVIYEEDQYHNNGLLSVPEYPGQSDLSKPIVGVDFGTSSRKGTIFSGTTKSSSIPKDFQIPSIDQSLKPREGSKPKPIIDFIPIQDNTPNQRNIVGQAQTQGQRVAQIPDIIQVSKGKVEPDDIIPTNPEIPKNNPFAGNLEIKMKSKQSSPMFGKIRTSSLKTKYVPSVVSGVFNIRGRSSKMTTSIGLGIRPLPMFKKSRRRK
jgi:hypothetical protein